jgi:uncharacterized membrane protein
MNKTEYMESLRKALQGLAPSEVEEIVRDQDEHITEATRSGRSEQEVIGALGSPADLAKEMKAGQHIKAAVSETKLISKTDKVFRAVFALCVLAPFNVIVVLGPFLAVCGVLFAFWITAFAGLMAGVAILGLSFLAIPINLALFFGAFFGSISGMGFSLLAFVACYLVTLWFLKITLWYLNKNLEFVTGEVRT